MRFPGRDGRGSLLRRLPQGSAGAEIGVWKGDFSARILRAVRPAKLHLIDPWAFAGDEAHRGAWYGGAVAPDQTAMDAIHADVLRRFDAEIAAGVVEVHRRPSAEAAALLADGSLDWAYVDGDHLYDSVRSDLALFGRKVRPGGLLAGDDYGVAGWWADGVTRAVDELVEQGGHEVVSLEAHQFVLRTAPSRS